MSDDAKAVVLYRELKKDLELLEKILKRSRKRIKTLQLLGWSVDADIEEDTDEEEYCGTEYEYVNLSTELKVTCKAKRERTQHLDDLI